MAYITETDEKVIEVKTVVPTALIKEIVLQIDRYYCRAGGYLYEYKGNRTFEKSIAFIPKMDTLLDLKLAMFGEDLICLV